MEKQHHWLLHPKMLLLKLIMTLVFGSASCLIPYLTIHMQSIGLTVEEIATIYLVMLFTTFMAPAITGFLVDKFGKYKPVIITYFIINLLSHHALNLVPKRDYSHNLPDEIMIKEAFNGDLELKWLPCNSQDCKSESHVRQYANKCMENCFSLFENKKSSEKPVYSQMNNDTNELELSCRIKLNVDSGSMKDCLMNCKYGNETKICSEIARTTMDVTFWLYLFIRFIATVIFQGSLTMVDAAAFTMIERYGGDFGKEKLFSSLGMAISTPFAGILIDWYSTGLNYTNYDPAFYTYDILLIISVFAMFAMPLGEKPPAQNIGKNLKKILTMPHVVIFLVFLFIAGNYWGFIENYLFVIMKEMGAPNYLLGLTYTIGTIVSIPMLYCSEKFTSLFGFINLLVIAFFAHAGRILAYSFMENPFWCFPVEILEAVSCYFMWVVATIYCSILAPPDLVATLIGVGVMVHFCMGKGSGSFIGGLLIGKVGTRNAFQYIGYSAIILGIIYKIIHHFYLRHYEVGRKTSEEDKVSAEKEADPLQKHRHNRKQSIIIEELNKRLSIGSKFEGYASLVNLSMIEQKCTCSDIENCKSTNCSSIGKEIIEKA